jgi:hypothetical protein
MIRALTSLSKIMDKAVAQAKAGDIALSTLLEARLAPDMHPLPFQIQSASDGAKGCAARLAGIAPPAMADTEASFALDAIMAEARKHLPPVPQATAPAKRVAAGSKGFGPDPDVVVVIQAARGKKKTRIQR